MWNGGKSRKMDAQSETCRQLQTLEKRDKLRKLRGQRRLIKSWNFKELKKRQYLRKFKNTEKLTSYRVYELFFKVSLKAFLNFLNVCERMIRMQFIWLLNFSSPLKQRYSEHSAHVREYLKGNRRWSCVCTYEERAIDNRTDREPRRKMHR